MVSCVLLLMHVTSFYAHVRTVAVMRLHEVEFDEHLFFQKKKRNKDLMIYFK